MTIRIRNFTSSRAVPGLTLLCAKSVARSVLCAGRGPYLAEKSPWKRHSAPGHRRMAHGPSSLQPAWKPTQSMQAPEQEANSLSTGLDLQSSR